MTCFFTAFHDLLDWFSPFPPSSTGTSRFLLGKLSPLLLFSAAVVVPGAACFLEFGRQRKGIRGPQGFVSRPR